jgi:hypothetical protein
MFLALAVGDTTRQTYNSGVASYITFMDQTRLSSAFPADITTLCLWIASLAAPPRSLAVGTCKVYLAAVVTRHTELGFDNPLQGAPPVLDRLLMGIKRYSAGSASKPKLPITATMLRQMRAHLDLRGRSACLLWAMLWVATAGLLRISEFTTRSARGPQMPPLLLSHLAFFGQDRSSIDVLTSTQHSLVRHMVLHLQASKTDPFRTGVDIVIASADAIEAVHLYLAHLRLQRPRPATPLFALDDLSAVPRGWLMSRVLSLLRKIGHNPDRFSSHSFRKGGAVSLQEARVEDSLVRRMGRWKSDAFHLYVRDPALDTLISASSRL